MKGIESSYKENNYGALFETITRIYKPDICVELGCLNGYSGIYTARGLKKNRRGKLYIIDLFENYKYKHCSYLKAKKNFSLYGVSEFVEFIRGDVFEKCADLRFDKIDFLHIDISNNGDVLKKIFNTLDDKITEKTIIIFEGGSVERDNIEWMKQFGKKPLRDFINNKQFQNKFEYFTFNPFPSLTICRKKGRV